jgi:uncharacterized protein (TIRG00374 family)
MSNRVGSRWGSRRAITHLLLLVGLVLFAALLWRIGLDAIVRSILNAGWYLPLALLPQALIYALHTYGWWATFPKEHQALGWTTLFQFNLAGNAIQLVTPSVSQAGELTRVHLLLFAGLGTDISTASVITAKITITIAELFYIGIGLAVGINYLVVDPSLINSMFVGVLVLSIALLSVLAWQRSGLFRPLIWFSRRFGVFTSALDRHEDSLRSADRLLKEFIVSRRLWNSSFLFFSGWAAHTLEAWVLMWILGLPVDLISAFIIPTWLVLVVRLTMFVPANLGTYEAGTLLVFSVLGLSPENAIAFALLCRLRQLCWAGVGFGILSRNRNFHKISDRSTRMTVHPD